MKATFTEWLTSDLKQLLHFQGILKNPLKDPLRDFLKDPLHKLELDPTSSRISKESGAILKNPKESRIKTSQVFRTILKILKQLEGIHSHHLREPLKDPEGCSDCFATL